MRPLFGMRKSWRLSGKVATVFVSYARENYSEVKSVIDVLADGSVRSVAEVFFDIDVAAGANWDEEIRLNLWESHVVLFFLTKEWTASQACHTELEMVIESWRRDQRPVPLFINLSLSSDNELINALSRNLLPSPQPLGLQSPQERIAILLAIQKRFKQSLSEEIIRVYDVWETEEDEGIEFNDLHLYVIKHGIDSSLRLSRWQNVVLIFASMSAGLCLGILAAKVTYLQNPFLLATISILLSCSTSLMLLHLQPKTQKNLLRCIIPSPSNGHVSAGFALCAFLPVSVVLWASSSLFAPTHPIKILATTIISFSISRLLFLYLFRRSNTVRTLKIFQDAGITWSAFRSGYFLPSPDVVPKVGSMLSFLRGQTDQTSDLENDRKVAPAAGSKRQNSDVAKPPLVEPSASEDDDTDSLVQGLRVVVDFLSAKSAGDEYINRERQKQRAETVDRIVEIRLLHAEDDRHLIDELTGIFQAHPLSNKIRFSYSSMGHITTDESIVGDVFLVFLRSTSIESSIRFVQHLAKERFLIPVLLDDCDYYRVGIGIRQALPVGGRPVEKFADREEAFRSIAQGVFDSLYEGSFPAPEWFALE